MGAPISKYGRPFAVFLAALLAACSSSVIHEHSETTDLENPQQDEVSITPNPDLSSPSGHSSYPRLAGPLQHVQRWPQDMLYSFEEIAAYNTVETIELVKQRARDQGRGDWADRVRFTVNYCIQVSPLREPTQWPPPEPSSWEYTTAFHNPVHAQTVAIYENAIRGVDWLLRDFQGDPVPVWDHLMATNWSPGCPKGVWDGRFSIDGVDYDLGDTRGLTLVEWLSGPMKDAVIRNPSFLAAIDGITLEDGPFVGLPCWMHEDTLVDPDGTGDFMSCQEYAEYAYSGFEHFMVNFVGDLKDELIFRTNTAYFRPGIPDTPDRVLVRQNMHGPKFEQYGGWGGWPNWDNPAWFGLWDIAEEFYEPFGPESFLPPLDEIVGQEIATAQCMPKREWSAAKRHEWMRHCLGHALMFDGSVSFSWYDDQFGRHFIDGEIDEWPDFPEMHVSLGLPIGKVESHVEQGFEDYPLHYRRFQKGQETFTVAVNVWNVDVRGIPKTDSVWFQGVWPQGPFSPM